MKPLIKETNQTQSHPSRIFIYLFIFLVSTTFIIPYIFAFIRAQKFSRYHMIFPFATFSALMIQASSTEICAKNWTLDENLLFCLLTTIYLKYEIGHAYKLINVHKP